MDTLELGMTVTVIDTSITGVITSISTVEKTDKKKFSYEDGMYWPVYGWCNDAVHCLTLNKIDETKCFYFIELDNDVDKIYSHDRVKPLSSDDVELERHGEWKIMLESDKIKFELEIGNTPFYFDGFDINRPCYALTIKGLDTLVSLINHYSLYDGSYCIIDPLLVVSDSGQTIYDLAPNLPNYIWDEMGRLLAMN